MAEVGKSLRRFFGAVLGNTCATKYSVPPRSYEESASSGLFDDPDRESFALADQFLCRISMNELT